MRLDIGIRGVTREKKLRGERRSERVDKELMRHLVLPFDRLLGEEHLLTNGLCSSDRSSEDLSSEFISPDFGIWYFSMVSLRRNLDPLILRKLPTWGLIYVKAIGVLGTTASFSLSYFQQSLNRRLGSFAGSHRSTAFVLLVVYVLGIVGGM